MGPSWNAASHSLWLTFTSAVAVPSVFTNVGDFTCDGTGGTTIAGSFTTGGSQTYGNAVTLTADAVLTSTGGGDITFAGTVVSTGGAAHGLTLASDADIEFRAAVGDGSGGGLGAITILSARDVTAEGTVTAASLVQLAGTGTTTLRQDVTTSGVAGVNITTAHVLLDGLTISALGGGMARFNGPVELADNVTIETDGGDIEFTALATIDSQIGEHNNLRLNAGSGGVYFKADIGTAAGGDHRIGFLRVETAGTIDMRSNTVLCFGDILFNSSGDVSIREVPPGLSTVTGRTFTVNAGGSLTIENGAAVGSDTGLVSNAPPLFRPDPDDPNRALVPGDRVHAITGTIGGDELLGDHLERGENLTLTVRWGDSVTTVIPHLHAGDHLEIFVDEAGNGVPVITHVSDTGPITFRVSREYSIPFLATVTDVVRSTLVLTNDPGVILKDAGAVNLNRASAVASVKVAGELSRWSDPPPEYLQPPPIEMPGQRRVAIETGVTPLEESGSRYDELRPQSEASIENMRIWYIVRVLPSGMEGERYPLSDTIASDPARLFESLKEKGLPNGRYRVYLEESGFPRRLVYEFYKSGNSFGEPVRERGPGSNPIQENQPPSTPGSDQRSSQWRTQTEEAALLSRPAGCTGVLSPERDGASSVDRRVGCDVVVDDGRPQVDGPVEHEDDPANDAGKEAAAGGDPERIGGSIGRLAHPALAAAIVAMGRSRIRNSRPAWTQCADEALEHSSEKAWSRGARLGRWLRR